MILECRILPAARLFYYSFSIISERTRRESKNTNFFLALQRIILSLFILFSLLPHSINGSRFWNLYGPDRSGIYGGAQGIGGLECTYNETSGTTYDHVKNFFGDTVGIYTDKADNRYDSVLGGYGPMPGSSVNGNLQPQWRGHYLDPTGFISMGARYYDPQNGRFISPDPLGHGASMSLYDYCNGDPVNGLDPDGRCVEGSKAGWANGNGAFVGTYDSSHANSQLAYGLGWTVGGALGDVNAAVARPVAYAAALSLYGLNTAIESTENFLGGPGAGGALASFGFTAAPFATAVTIGSAGTDTAVNEMQNIVFWAGRNGANNAAAESFAAATGAKTLAQTTEGMALDASLDYSNMSVTEIRTAWTDLSEKAAASQSGTVHSFAGGAGPDTVWKTVELPTLLRNPNVQKIIIKDATQPWRTIIKYPN